MTNNAEIEVCGRIEVLTEVLIVVQATIAAARAEAVAAGVRSKALPRLSWRS